MNKTVTTIVGIVGVFLAAVIGGYIYAEMAIRNSVEAVIANATQYPGVQSVETQSIDVNLLGNTVTVKGMKTRIDNAAFIAALAQAQGKPIPDTVSFNGTMKQRAETTVLTGARELLLGETVIPAMRADGISLDMDMEVIETAVQGQTKSVKFKMTAAIARVQGTGIDIAAYLNGGPPFKLDTLRFDTMGFQAFNADIVAFEPTTPGATDAAGGNTLKVRYSIAEGHGADISPAAYGLIQLDDIEFNVRPPKPDQDPIVLTAQSFRIHDVEMLEGTPVKLAYDIEEIRFGDNKMPDPRLKAMLNMLGTDEIVVDVGVAYDLDMNTQTGVVGPIQVNLHNVGRANVRADLVGLPGMDALQRLEAQTMEPQEMQAIINALALKSLSLGYDDAGAVKTFVASQAMQATNGDVAPVAEALAMQGAALISATHGEQKAQQVFETLKTYLTEPDEIRIDLTREPPLPLAQLQAAVVLQGPMALSLFDLTVTTP